MVVDGNREGPYGMMWPPSWSDDESRFGYIAMVHGKLRAIIDHRVEERFEALGDNPVFSRNGKRVGFVGVEEGRKFAVIDGERGPTFGEVEQITFSPGGDHVAYVACDSETPVRESGYLKNGFVVLDGRRLKTYDAIEYLTFSPDGCHIAFSARIGSRHLVVADEVELEYLDRVEEGLRASAFGLTFSPDGMHLSWYTYTGEHEVGVVVDGRVVDRSSSLSEKPRFDGDSRHVAFGVIKGRELWWRVIHVNGR